MLLAQTDSGFKNRIVLSTQNEKENPLDVIKSIFLEVKTEEIGDMIKRVIEVCLTTHNRSFDKPSERYELLLIFKKLEHLIEAASSL